MSTPDTLRIGVLTFHHVPNYGAFLQAWALTQALKKLGHEVEVIDYRPERAISHYRDVDDRSRLSALRRLQSWRLLRFAITHLPCSTTCHTSEDLARIANRYDVLIFGSDQIWKTDGFRGFDQAYFGGFADGSRIRKIAYAPSCGDLTSFGDNADTVRSHLADFARLSARDDATQQLLSGLGFTAPRVVDPTLLVNFDDLTSTPRRSRPYLLIYGSLPKNVVGLLDVIAKERSLDVVTVGSRSKIGHARPAVLPNQWLGFFRHADCIVTSAFHGVMFALINRKSFIAIPAKEKTAKVNDATAAFGMQGHLVADGADVSLDALRHAMDCSSDYGHMETMIKSSHDYLRDALND